MNKKLVVFPIEIWKREIDAKLFLAIKLILSGYRVLIAEMTDVNIRKVKNAIILHKDHAVWSDVLFKNWIKRNNSLYAFDEEGLITSNDDYYIKHRVSDWAIKNLSGIFMWGHNQENLIKKKDITVPCYKIGSCKLELSSKHKIKFNDGNNSKILVNTRFPYLNGRYSSKQSLEHLGIISNDIDLEKFENFIESEYIIRNEFIKLLKLLAANNYLITLRPHPLEDVSYYEDYFNSYTNIKVNNTDDLYDQIKENNILIHDGCTTAIEASSMGRKVYGLRPSNLKDAYDDTANGFSVNFNNAEDLLNEISNGDFKLIKNVNAESKVFGWGNLNSSQFIIDIFNKDLIDNRNSPKSKIDIRLIVKKTIFQINKLSFGVLMNFKVVKNMVNGRDNLNKKFPDVNCNDLNEKINNLNKKIFSNYENELLKKIRINKLSKKAFTIDL